MTTREGLVRQPRVGDQLENGRFGAVEVLEVKDHGRTLVVQTTVHGIETVQRAPEGWWTRA